MTKKNLNSSSFNFDYLNSHLTCLAPKYTYPLQSNNSNIVLGRKAQRQLCRNTTARAFVFSTTDAFNKTQKLESRGRRETPACNLINLYVSDVQTDWQFPRVRGPNCNFSNSCRGQRPSCACVCLSFCFLSITQTHTNRHYV